MTQLREVTCRGKNGTCANPPFADDLCEEDLPIECLEAYTRVSQAFAELRARFPQDNHSVLENKVKEANSSLDQLRLEGLIGRCKNLEREILQWEALKLIDRASELNNQFASADVRAHNLTQSARRYLHRNDLVDAIRTAREAVIQFEVRERMKRRLDDARAQQKPSGENEESA